MNHLVTKYPFKVRKRSYPAKFRRAFALTDFETAILNLINIEKEGIDWEKLGLILGFGMADIPKLEVRKDIAEIEIYCDYLAQIKNYYLIDVEDEKVSLTNLGKHAVENKEKFKFYKGLIELPEFFDLTLSDKNKLFPFKDLGVEIKLSNESEVGKPYDLEDDTNDIALKAELFYKNRVNFNDKIIIDQIDSNNQVSISEISIDVSVKYDTEQNIEILAGDKVSTEFTEEIDRSENKEKKEELTHFLEYQILLQDSEQLESEDLVPFNDIIHWESLLDDKRLNWTAQLIQLISKNADGQIWRKVSSLIPEQKLKNCIDQFTDHWDWITLSDRLSFDFIVDSIKLYPWDIRSFLDRLNEDELEITLYKIIDKVEFDYDSIIERVSDEFIKQNISKIDCNAILQKRRDLSLDLLISSPELNWDWQYVTSNVELDFLIKHYSLLENFISPDIILKRLISSNIENDYATLESICKKAIRQGIRVQISSSDQICHDLKVISILDDNELLFWGDEQITGFEGNPNIVWDQEYFDLYSKNVRSLSAIQIVSSKIINHKIVLDNPNFPWSWETISGVSKLLVDKEFIHLNIENLNPLLLVQNAAKDVVYDLFNELEVLFPEPDTRVFIESICKNLNISQIVTLIINDQIEEAYIDWEQILSLANREEIENEIIHRGSELLKFDSKYKYSRIVTKLFEFEFILDNVDSPWDWKYLTENVIEENVLKSNEFIQSYAKFLYWPYIIENWVTLEDLGNYLELENIGKVLSITPVEISEKSWTYITKNLPWSTLLEFIEKSKGNEFFKWNWEYISGSTKVDFSIQFLNTYADEINWNRLSQNSIVNNLFNNRNKDLYPNYVEWEETVLKYLDAFPNHWDFKSLSKINNITWNTTIISRYIQKWDWSILSSTKSRLLTKRIGKTVELDQDKLNRFSEVVDWESLSARDDVSIPQKLVEKYLESNWDWTVLSRNIKLEIDNDFIVKFKEKDWDWKALSARKELKFNIEFINELVDKDWDWQLFSSEKWIDNSILNEYPENNWNWGTISRNNNLVFDKNLLKILSVKEAVSWDAVLSSPSVHITSETIEIIYPIIKDNSDYWSIISQNSDLSFNDNQSLLEKYKTQWNWDHIIEGFKIDFNNNDLLKKYSEYLDWDRLCDNQLFNPTLDILREHKSKINWYRVTRTIKLTDEILNSFRNQIDWHYISNNQSTEFSIDFFEKYKDYWDLNGLLENPAVDRELHQHIEDYLGSNIPIRFLSLLNREDSKWNGYVYHFTHITNAIHVIESKKVLSRNKATGFADAAGNVVSRRETAHNFARFYFRPLTPTQFYNECLGKDIEDRYYNKAIGLGLPKCPIPVFFRFRLQEILNMQPDRCYISNGNMQTNWARIGPISEMINNFYFNDVYSTLNTTSEGEARTYVDKSQQEFLIKDEFDFSDLSNYDILVKNPEDRKQLISMLSNSDEMINKIKVASSYDEIFNNENKEIYYCLERDSVEISSSYNGNGIAKGRIQIEIPEGVNYEIVKGNIISKNENIIEAYPEIKIRFKEDYCIKANFIDEVTNKEWQIIDYCYGNRI